jgi:hypothetical protein
VTTFRPTETQCEDAIVAAAKTHGWRIHAERTARMGSGRWATPIKGHAGWPDLVMCRGAVVRVVELKRKPNKVEPAQQAWHDALAAAGINTEVVWVPEGQATFIESLR